MGPGHRRVEKVEGSVLYEFFFLSFGFQQEEVFLNRWDWI